MAHLFTSLKGLSAIVTGGSSGLGLATAKRLLDGGCKVLVCDLQKSPEFSEIEDRCLYHKTDVASEEDATAAVQLAKKEFSRLDVLVNCAGIALAAKTFNMKKQKPHSLNSFTNVLRVNTIGTFNMIRIAAPVMIENEPDHDNLRGVIINTASVAAFEGQVGQVAYAASKAAVVGMTLPLARDFAREGIRVVAIAPGLFETNTVCGIEGFKKREEEYLTDVQLAVSRFGKATEYAELVAQLIINHMMNGSTVRLDAAGRLVYM